jgi:hypothetical protein
MVEDVQATWTEAVFTSRWALVEGYHLVGERLRQEDKHAPMAELVNRCALDMGVSERKLWYAVQFYDKFPDLNKLPGGKNVSWTKIRREYLPEETKPKEEVSTITCPKCKGKGVIPNESD